MAQLRYSGLAVWKGLAKALPSIRFKSWAIGPAGVLLPSSTKASRRKRRVIIASIRHVVKMEGRYLFTASTYFEHMIDLYDGSVLAGTLSKKDALQLFQFGLLERRENGFRRDTRIKRIWDV